MVNSISTDEQARQTLLELIHAPALAQMVYVAAELGIADLLAEGPRGVEQLAAAARVKEEPLYRVLRALSSVSMFQELEGRRFALTPAASPLRRDAPNSVRDWARLRARSWHAGSWGLLGEVVRSEQSGFRLLKGTDVLDYLGNSAEEAQSFHAGMHSIHHDKCRAVASSYDFSRAGTVVDVGGGTGGMLLSVLTAHEGVRGILVELPHALEEARLKAEAAGLVSRYSCLAADMFKDELPRGDLYIASNLLQNFDDEQASQVIRACAKAMEPSGAVLIVEMLLGAPNEPSVSSLSDIELLVLTERGRERSLSDYARLLATAGLSVTKVVSTGTPWSIVEGRLS